MKVLLRFFIYPFPLATYHFLRLGIMYWPKSSPLEGDILHLDEKQEMPVVVETLKIRVKGLYYLLRGINAMAPCVGLEPTS